MGTGDDVGNPTRHAHALPPADEKSALEEKIAIPPDKKDETIVSAARPDAGSGTDVTERSSQQVSSTATTDEAPVLPLYTTFSTWQKRLIVLGATVSVLISSLTTNIYLPALNIFAEHYHVSAAKINLSITIYMAFQSLVPTFVGGYADRSGRRPAYLICFTIYVFANIGLALSDTFATLMVLRSFQSVGASALQTLCQAVLADITTSAERGYYVGFLAMPTVLGPSLGPLLGGTLADYLGWRGIFVFLAILGFMHLVVLLLFYPETCRKIVGDGSITPPKKNRTLWQLFNPWRATTNEHLVVGAPNLQTVNDTRPQSAVAVIFQSFTLLFEKELGLVLFYAGLLFSGIFAIAATIPSEFARIYGLSAFHIGLIYLPMFAGSLVAIGLVGPGLNRNFRRHAIRIGIPRELLDGRRQVDMKDFPIEKARLEVAMPPLLLSIVVMISWGWVLEAGASLAVPCVLVFLVGVGITSANNAFTALIADLHSGKAGSAAAANNIIKYMLAAIMGAAIEYMVLGIGPGWAYTIIGGLYIVFLPFLLLAMFKGMKWREVRRQKQEAQERSDQNV
ncbi:putative Major facilitator superfamily (MFS) profile domain-containing protein [Seiridium cardinale]